MSCRLERLKWPGSVGWSRWTASAWHPSGLLVCRSHWTSASGGPAPVLGRFPVWACSGTCTGRGAFAGMASLLFAWLPELAFCRAPGEWGPHGSARGSWLSLMEEGWSLRGRAEQPAAKLAQLCGKPAPLAHVIGPALFRPSWFKPFWWLLPATLKRLRSDCRSRRWQNRVQASVGGSRDRWEAGARWASNLLGGPTTFSGGTAAAGGRQGKSPSAASSLAFAIQDPLVLPRQCLMSCFFILFYLAHEIVNN